MSKELPIVVSAENQLMQEMLLDKQALLKLEAWLNFETLKANWYGNEARLIDLNITLITANKFHSLFKETIELWQIDTTNLFAIQFGDSSKTNIKNKVIIGLEENFVVNVDNYVNFEKKVQPLMTNIVNKIASHFQLDHIAANLP